MQYRVKKGDLPAEAGQGILSDKEDTQMTVGEVVKADPGPGVGWWAGGNWGMLLILLGIIVLAAFVPRWW
jgi:hypothetical protein